MKKFARKLRKHFEKIWDLENIVTDFEEIIEIVLYNFEKKFKNLGNIRISAVNVLK